MHNATEDGDKLYALLQQEMENLLPQFDAALEKFSMPGDDAESILTAIEDYAQLLRRVIAAAQIAELLLLVRLLQHIIHNLDILKQQATALTARQKMVFAHWLGLFIAYLKAPHKQNSCQRLAKCLTDTEWPLPLDTHASQNLANKLHLIDKPRDSSLVEFPTLFPSIEAAHLPAPRITPNNKHQERGARPSVYEKLTINRKNAWLHIQIDKLALLMPQTDIKTIETSDGLELDHSQASPAAWYRGKKEKIPVYYLNAEMLLKPQAPKHYSRAIILKSRRGAFGLLCEALQTYTAHHSLEIEAIPTFIKYAHSPVHFVTLYKGKLTYILRAEDLITYIEKTT